MTQVTNTFEGGTNNTNITTGNSGGTSGTAFDAVVNGSGDAVLKYDNTHSQGTLAAKISTTTSSTAYLAWTTAFNGGGTITDHYGRVYLYMTANPPAGQSFITFLTAGGATVCARINIGTDGTLRLVDKGGTIRQTFTNPITLNQWVRIEWHFVHSATVGQMEAKLFLTATSSTATETKTDSANRDLNATTNEVRFGNNLGIANLTAFWMDQLVAGATAYPGPAGGASITGASSLALTDTITSAGVRTRLGASTLPLVFTVTSAGAHNGVGATTLAFTDSFVSSGVRTRFAASTLPIVLTVASAGTRTRLGASTLAEALAITSAGTRATFGASTLPIVLTVTSSSTLTISGASLVALTDAIASAGTRTAMSSSTLGLLLGITSASQVAHFGASTLAELLTIASAGTRSTTGASSLPLLLAILSDGGLMHLGETELPMVLTITSSGLSLFVYPTVPAGSIAHARGSERIARTRPGRISRPRVGSFS